MNSGARCNSLRPWRAQRLLVPLAATLLALWFVVPSCALARSLVPPQDAISEYQARHLLARLYAEKEATLGLSEAMYARLLAQRPDDPEVSLELAGVLLRLNRQAEARELLHALDQTDPRVAAGMGDAFFASGRMAEAADAYARAMAAGSARADLPLLLAQALSWSGQEERALPLLADLHAAAPGNLDVALLYARALTRTGERARSRAVLDAVAAAAPGNSAVLLELADQEAAQGHLSAARQYVLQAMRADGSAQTRQRAARIMNQWGAFHRAAGLYRESLEEDGTDSRVSLALAEALSNAQRYEEAEGVLRRLLLDDPARDDARLVLAEVKLREKDGEAALAVLSPLPADGGEADMARIRALALAGRYEEAASAWARLAGSDPPRLVEQGRMLLRAGDREAAREVFGRALTLAPKDPAARYHAALMEQDFDALRLARHLPGTEADPAVLTRWAELFSVDGRYEAAIVCLESALERDGDYFPARMALAENLAYARRYDESLDILGRMAARFPDSSKVQLTRARVLAWSRRYDESLAAYEALRRSDPSDPVPLREMARVAFWDKRADEGSAHFLRLMEPPVDELLAEGLEADLERDPGNRTLARAAARARGSALEGGIYQAYAELSESGAAQERPELFARLLPVYRIQHAAALERRAKMSAYDTRFSPAVDALEALTDLRPGNEEAWFDLAQAQCALGLCAEETATYKRLLALNPQHSLAARALARRERLSGPWVRAGMNLWQEKGHGNLADIVRLRSDLQASLPVECGVRVEVAGHRWQEMPQSPSRSYEALGGTLGVSGVFNRWLSGQAAWTAKRFGSSEPRDTDQYRARVELNLRDMARVGLAFERTDEVANRYALLEGTQADHFILDARGAVTRSLDLEAGIQRIQYSDDNTGEAAHLTAGYALTDHPRVLKVILRGDYRHTARSSQDIYTGPTLTGITHPYWTPQGYIAGSATLEWRADMAEDYFCGAQRHFVDLKLTGGTDSDANNAVRFEAEWVRDFADRWTIEARGLWHRSQQWDANGLWTGVRYGF